MVISANRGELVFWQQKYIAAGIGCFKTINLSFDGRITPIFFVKASDDARETDENGHLRTGVYPQELFVQIFFIGGPEGIQFGRIPRLNYSAFAEDPGESACFHVHVVFRAGIGCYPNSNGMESCVSAPIAG